MQRKLRQTACVLVTNASLLMACATEVLDESGDRSAGGSGAEAGGGEGGGAGSGTAGSAGGASGGRAGAGGSSSGTANGGGGGGDVEPPMGGEGGTGGGTGGTNGGIAGSGGRAGAGGGGGSSGGGSGGKGGGGGAGGSGGSGGSGGGGGSGGAGGTAGAGGGASGAAGSGGSGGSGGGTVNLIDNSGFETNTTGWSVFGGSATIATTTEQAHSGTRSLVITGRTQTYQGPRYNVLSAITPGTSYRFGVWGRLTASNPTGSLTVTLHYTCSGGTSPADNYFRWVDTTTASSSAWTHLTSVRTFPTCVGGTMGAASIYVESPTATLSYYIDDVVLSAP